VPDPPSGAYRGPAGAPRGAAGPPGRLLLRTGGECDFGPEHLLDVFGRQRQRFVTALHGFGPADWAAPTRCADWSAHEVVRHLCDGAAVLIAAGPDDRTLDHAERFDPRTTPRRWLAASAGESPGATLGRLAVTTGELLALARGRLARGRRFDVRLPYGPADWTVLLLHAFWDAWIHERDVLLARGADHPTDGDATAYATAYGVFIAVAVASMFGDQLQETLTLGGDGGGVFDVDGRRGVTVTVDRVAAAGPGTAGRGAAGPGAAGPDAAGPGAAEVADALAGRTPIAAALPDLPASSRAALSRLADVFRAPAGRAPT
jgi:uncharacterized protein (TIGR03083 family)